jgi:thiamine-phosphate pyrophosphorylase
VNHPLQKPIIYLITRGDADSGNFNIKKKEILERVRLAAAAGVSLIQIREKNLTARSLFELTEAAAKITRKSAAKLLVNGRADIALAAGADGVHLPADGLSARMIRHSFPSGFLIGVSTHSVEAASAARTDGADLATFGPVFESPGKSKPRGINALKRVCKLLHPFPVIALGGIDEANHRHVLGIGAGGFAAIRFLNEEDNLRRLLANP